MTSKWVKTTCNVRDLETGLLIWRDTVVELDEDKAARWVAQGVAEFEDGGKVSVEVDGIESEVRDDE